MTPETLEVYEKLRDACRTIERLQARLDEYEADDADDRPLRVFKLEANCTFMARDLDHAMYVLARHFMDMACIGGEAEVIFGPGSEITVHGIKP